MWNLAGPEWCVVAGALATDRNRSGHVVKAPQEAMRKIKSLWMRRVIKTDPALS